MLANKTAGSCLLRLLKRQTGVAEDLKPEEAPRPAVFRLCRDGQIRRMHALTAEGGHVLCGFLFPGRPGRAKLGTHLSSPQMEAMYSAASMLKAARRWRKASGQ
jgi:hypothetical protein